MWEGKPIVQPEWVKQSLAPSIAVSADGAQVRVQVVALSVRARATRGSRGAAPASAASAPIDFPDDDLLVVFTGWNILPNRPSLTPRMAIDRVLEAIPNRK